MDLPSKRSRAHSHSTTPNLQNLRRVTTQTWKQTPKNTTTKNRKKHKHISFESEPQTEVPKLYKNNKIPSLSGRKDQRLTLPFPFSLLSLRSRFLSNKPYNWLVILTIINTYLLGCSILSE
ncbi:hypothetical protein MANES_12G049543v8 [Manihot esculenta]|uniref:Uncharacterized protein n=1 Tax=Manihot esculenta TaxID=3983 RepID=A0ACB7GQB4_MANES|nr:hypothetical protein MANES_12G049543v8 [Manihot esculenta]